MSFFGSNSVLSLDFASDRIKGVVGKISKKEIIVDKSFFVICLMVYILMEK